MARLVFIQNLAFEYLGTGYLTSSLRQAGHSVEIVIDTTPDFRIIKSRVPPYKPDLLCFSCTTGIHWWALEAASLLKQLLPQARTIFGGPHATFFPQIIDHPAVDMVCIGEGEKALCDVASALDSNADPSGIPNLWVKTPAAGIRRNDVRPLIDDLDSLPSPDRSAYRDGYRSLRLSRIAILTGRGCPFSCSFCSNEALRHIYKGKGRFVRRRSPGSVIKEIRHVVAAMPVRTVYFQDDTFLIDPDWTREFLPRYRDEVGRAFQCLVTADALNEENVAALKNAGCTTVFFGVETGNEQQRENLLGKRIRNETLLAASHLLHRTGIKFRTYNMLGLPGETLAQGFETIRLNRMLGTDYPWCSLYQPFPATELAQRAGREGLLKTEPGATRSYSFFVNGSVSSGDNDRLANLQKFFSIAVRMSWLSPLVKLLIRLPANGFFTLVFMLTYGYYYMKSERLTLTDLVRIGFANAGRFLSQNRTSGQSTSGSGSGA